MTIIWVHRDNRSQSVYCQTYINVGLDHSPVWNMWSVSWHPLAHRSGSWVRIMMCLSCTFLSLQYNVNNFKCITLCCFLLLCVWHAAYVSWWDFKWACLCSYKYIDCEWKQPNYQGLFWFNCRSVGWKISQKLVMTRNWQWHENHFWITFCFFEHGRQHRMSVATCFPCRLMISTKHKSSDMKSRCLVDTNGLQTSWDFFLDSFLFTSKAWKPLSTFGSFCYAPHTMATAMANLFT